MAMAKYPALILAVSGYLKDKGFRQKALGFNRAGADSECTEVVTIQRGVRRLVGKFRIELGIYIPKINPLAHPNLSIPTFPQAINCTFRERLSKLAGWKDTWWTSEKSEDYTEIVLLLERFGWAFLERWNSRERIIQNLLEDRQDGRASHNSFSTVAIFNDAGMKAEAGTILQGIYLDLQARNIRTDAATALADRLNIKLKKSKPNMEYPPFEE